MKLTQTESASWTRTIILYPGADLGILRGVGGGLGRNSSGGGGGGGG